MEYDIKCKKCRKLLFEDTYEGKLFFNAHHEPLLSSTKESKTECTYSDLNNLYLNEDLLPCWITLLVEAEKWSKGRINCPHCDSRIGGFDFVSGLKCECKHCILPPVHLIKSKLDLVTMTRS